MKLKPVLLFLGIIAIGGLLLSSWYLIHTSNLEFYNFGGKKIPSVEYVLGKQQHLSGFSNNTEKSNYRQYRYDSRLTSQEVQQYAEYLCSNEKFNLTGKTADQFVLSKPHGGTDKQIIMIINIKKNGYHLTFEIH